MRRYHFKIPIMLLSRLSQYDFSPKEVVGTKVVTSAKWAHICATHTKIGIFIHTSIPFYSGRVNLNFNTNELLWQGNHFAHLKWMCLTQNIFLR